LCLSGPFKHRPEKPIKMQRTIISISTGCFLLLFISLPSIITGTSKKVIRSEFPLPVAPKHPLLPLSPAFSEANFLYDSLRLDQIGLSKQALQYAIKGYSYLQKKGLLAKQSILAICDFSQSSKRKRLYLIDVENKRVLLNTYVAHGKNSGSEYANSFSNNPSSLKSSLGFYGTSRTYHGCHGLALRINGMEKGFNDKANARGIVVHGADYVGTDFLGNNPFSGRSYGCPAVPAEQTPLVINIIKEGSCLFIYHPTKQYLKRSKILNS